MTKTWDEVEKEFDRKFIYSGIPAGIKPFYRTAFYQMMDELREKIEGKKRSVYMLNNSEFTDYQAKEWNDALDEVLSFIPKEEV